MQIYSLSIMLILVMDPLGNIPLFLSILKKYEPKRQVQIILRESAIAFVIFVLFLFCGRYLLQGLHVSTSALSIAGGIILLMISIKMIFPSKDKTVNADEELEEPLIVPLAVPLTAGPSALAVIMLFTSRHPDHTWALLAAVIIACVVFILIMLGSRYLMQVLGKRVLIAIERLMGMVLTTMAVQMLLSGVIDSLQHPLLLSTSL